MVERSTRVPQRGSADRLGGLPNMRRLLALLLLVSTAACTDAGVYALQGSGVPGPDRTGREYERRDPRRAPRFDVDNRHAGHPECGENLVAGCDAVLVDPHHALLQSQVADAEENRRVRRFDDLNSAIEFAEDIVISRYADPGVAVKSIEVDDHPLMTALSAEHRAGLLVLQPRFELILAA